MPIAYAVALIEVVEGVPAISMAGIYERQAPWILGVGEMYTVVLAESGVHPTFDDARRELETRFRHTRGGEHWLREKRAEGANASVRFFNYACRVIATALRLRFAAAGLGGYTGAVQDLATIIRESLQHPMEDDRFDDSELKEVRSEVTMTAEDLESFRG